MSLDLELIWLSYITYDVVMGIKKGAGLISVFLREKKERRKKLRLFSVFYFILFFPLWKCKIADELVSNDEIQMCVRDVFLALSSPS